MVDILTFYLNLVITTVEKTVEVVSILDYGLPPLGSQRGSSSEPSESQDHSSATLVQRDFKLLRNVHYYYHTSTIWAGLHRQSDCLHWGSESDIQFHVRRVLEDIIIAAGLYNIVMCFSELGVAQLCVDIWVVLANDIPIGVVEVKKPGKDIMESTRVHGQICDYMLRLRHFYGIAWVFGIVSTYKQWRFYWLPDCSDIAATTEIKTEPSQGNLEQPAVVPAFDQHVYLADQDRPKTPVKRQVCGSEVLEWDNQELPHLLVSVLLKMYYSPKCRVKLADPMRHYIVVTPASWFWSSLPHGFSLNFGGFPAKQTRNLFLLQDLRAGVHGRVWLACNGGGAVCVLKFAVVKPSSTNPDAEACSALEAEAIIWKNVWKLPVSVQKWCNHYALMMPYVLPVDDEQWETPEVVDAVKKAVDKLARAGYLHDDLNRRHVGLYQHDGILKAVLFDLAKMKSSKGSVTTAISCMMSALTLSD